MLDKTQWVTISRYLSPAHCDSLKSRLEKAGIPVRIEPEGSTENDLSRLKVPVNEATAAFTALSADIDDELRWPPPGERSRIGKILRRVLERSRRSFDSGRESDTSLDSALGAVRKDPSSPQARISLATALMDADESLGLPEPRKLELARLALDEAAYLGAGSAAAFEIAEICLESGENDEAEAWIDEADSSNADPSRAAYLRCELAFYRGDLKALKSAISEYRRRLPAPDFNLVYCGALLFAAGEKSAAIRLADAALRDGEFASDDEWVSAAALKIAMEGSDPETVRDLATVLGSDEEAESAVDDAKTELAGLRSEWKNALKGLKRSGKQRWKENRPRP